MREDRYSEDHPPETSTEAVFERPSVSGSRSPGASPRASRVKWAFDEAAQIAATLILNGATCSQGRASRPPERGSAHSNQQWG